MNSKAIKNVKAEAIDLLRFILLSEAKDVNTISLQVESMNRFANSLGFYQDCDSSCGAGYRAVEFDTYLSFDVIKALHNITDDNLYLGLGCLTAMINEDTALTFSLEEWELASSLKIVERVKLQRDRSRALGIKVQSHKVKLVNLPKVGV
ncbi:hypothetical protein NVP1121O_097 [Vibrio phage 1.121.O._10N.286.46.C4]|nr:hypothetical protein NVP1121O_097 [Vibrio phage 1.121.O._10N.286.46.C4]